MILCVTEQHRPDWSTPRHRYTLGEPYAPETWRTIWVIEDARMTTVERDALIRKMKLAGRLQCETMPYLLSELQL